MEIPSKEDFHSLNKLSSEWPTVVRVNACENVLVAILSQVKAISIPYIWLLLLLRCNLLA